MYIKKDYDFYDLLDACWSGAVDTLKTIQEKEKENELMDFLEECFSEETPDLTSINDFLWFKKDYIFEVLEIKKEDEE